MSLGAGVNTCATPTCWQTIPWDISLDGKLIVYPTPVPALALTTQPTTATLVREDLQTHARTTMGTIALNAAPTLLALSPDMHYVAFIGQQASAATHLVIFSITGQTVLSDTLVGQCAWRPDSAVLVAMPLIPSATDVPRLINVISGTATSLANLTTNYLWEN